MTEIEEIGGLSVQEQFGFGTNKLLVDYFLDRVLRLTDVARVQVEDQIYDTLVETAPLGLIHSC